MRKSILFICPDYHGAFLYRDTLRHMGWRVNVYVPEQFPEKLLYSEQDVISLPKRPTHSGQWPILFFLARIWYYILKSFWLIRHIFTYKYLFYYGDLTPIPLLMRNKWKHPVSCTLALAKFFGIKIIVSPSGCMQQETKENFMKLDEGNVCGNCGWSKETCNDERNNSNFDLVRRYADMMVGFGEMDSSQFKMTHFKYKSLDLDLWKPDLEIPEEHRLPKTTKLRILHSFIKENRENNGKNIKGSPSILSAIKQLKAEGHQVEYLYVNDIHIRDMRYYQVQADIAVEQLIYGWWGSTGVETMALGKPVVCYLRPSWKEFFFKTFPEYTALPIVEANTQNIYKVLKELVENKKYREKKGRESREFAEQHFNVKKNAKELVSVLEKL